MARLKKAPSKKQKQAAARRRANGTQRNVPVRRSAPTGGVKKPHRYEVLHVLAYYGCLCLWELAVFGLDMGC